jgi:hypothetical protein
VVDEAASGVGAGSGGEGEREEAEPRGQRSRAEDVLQVERAEQEEGKEQSRGEQHQDQPAADGAVSEPLDLEQRLRGLPLMGYEGSESSNAGAGDYERSRRRPTRGVGLRDRVDDRAEARGGEDRTQEVKPPPPRLVRVGGNDCQGGRGERDGDREVDVEDQPPVELGQEAADEDADRSASAADRSPGSERLHPLWAVERSGDE